jgi:homoserine kinase type II
VSVFTPVSLAAAREFVSAYGVGEIIDFQDIAAGVENSNFFVTTTGGRYVLTVFEKIPRADLGFYMGLLRHLSAAGVACAAPLLSVTGEVVGTLCGKPAALVQRLQGGDVAHPNAAQCRAVGVELAHLHRVSNHFGLEMLNWRGLSWWRQEASALVGLASPHELALIQSEVAHQANFDVLDLPRGIVHADLFRDNILWNDAGQPQMIDFYFACNEQLMWDVAITVNDWCLDFNCYPEATLDRERTRALLSGYASVRAFTPAEKAAWPQMLRAAALRSWLGRLGYHYYPRSSTLTHVKDHPFSERLLRYHIANEAANQQLIME